MGFHESIREADAGDLESIVKDIKKSIADLNWNSGLLNIYSANGVYHLSVGGGSNRKSIEGEEIIKLYWGASPWIEGVLYERMMKIWMVVIMSLKFSY